MANTSVPSSNRRKTTRTIREFQYYTYLTANVPESNSKLVVITSPNFSLTGLSRYVTTIVHRYHELYCMNKYLFFFQYVVKYQNNLEIEDVLDPSAFFHNCRLV